MEASNGNPNVTVLSSSTIEPAEATERRSMFLSNIDHHFNYNQDIVQFFHANPNYPVDTIILSYQSALEKLLVPYDFMAGRLQFNDEEGRLEIDCNGAGIGFVVASSELTLKELLNLEDSYSAFAHLVPKPTEGLKLEELPLLVIQVTSFKCGGFSFCSSSNHAAADGITLYKLLRDISALIANKPLVTGPSTDRKFLAARSQMPVRFSYLELSKSQPVKIFRPKSDTLQYKIFHLDPNQIASLKWKAKMEYDSKLAKNETTVTSTFAVVMAHIWRCKALANRDDADGDKMSYVSYVIDIRTRLRPPLPSTYAGNSILKAYANVTYRDLEEGPFIRIVEEINKGGMRMTSEYNWTLIGEGRVGGEDLPQVDLDVTSWLKFGVTEVEYPWGKPFYFCPIFDPKAIDLTVLLPSRGVGNGLEVVIALPAANINKFQELFYQASSVALSAL